MNYIAATAYSNSNKRNGTQPANKLYLTTSIQLREKAQ